jgi:hypothetical protein
MTMLMIVDGSGKKQSFVGVKNLLSAGTYLRSMRVYGIMHRVARLFSLRIRMIPSVRLLSALKAELNIRRLSVNP